MPFPCTTTTKFRTFDVFWRVVVHKIVVSVYKRYPVTDQKCSDARKSSEILASREYIGVFDVVSRIDARKSAQKLASPHNRKG